MLHPIEEYQLHRNAEPLIQMFQPFLKKYYELIRNQKMNWNNYDLRQFIKCYAKDEDQKKELKRSKFISLKTLHFTNELLKHFYELFESHFGSMTDDELYHELVCCLLQLANRYQHDQSSFEMYVYHSFRYEWKRRLDQIEKQHLHTIRYWDEYSDQNQAECLEEEKEYEAFLQGREVGVRFQHLRMIDRMILYFRYVLKKTDIEIGQLSGYHANYIGALRRKLIKQIQAVQGV